MALWREVDGDLVVQWHRMVDDAHGRPGDPRCGRTLEGLRFDGDTRWEQLPERARCGGCA